MECPLNFFKSAWNTFLKDALDQATKTSKGLFVCSHCEQIIIRRRQLKHHWVRQHKYEMVSQLKEYLQKIDTHQVGSAMNMEAEASQDDEEGGGNEIQLTRGEEEAVGATEEGPVDNGLITLKAKTRYCKICRRTFTGPSAPHHAILWHLHTYATHLKPPDMLQENFHLICEEFVRAEVLVTENGKNTFNCPHCPAILHSRVYNMRLHLIQQHRDLLIAKLKKQDLEALSKKSPVGSAPIQESDLVCDYCPHHPGFANIVSLESHRMGCHLETYFFKCKPDGLSAEHFKAVCEKFLRELVAEVPMTREQRFPCLHCPHLLGRRQTVKHHWLRKHQKILTCKLKEYLQNTDIPRILEETSLSCRYCGKSFLFLAAKQRHERRTCRRKAQLKEDNSGEELGRIQPNDSVKKVVYKVYLQDQDEDEEEEECVQNEQPCEEEEDLVDISSLVKMETYVVEAAAMEDDSIYELG